LCQLFLDAQSLSFGSFARLTAFAEAGWPPRTYQYRLRYVRIRTP
jgi:hypothetical protein